MQKLLTIITLALTLSGLPGLGQGYFNFSGPKRGVWDGFTGGLPPHLAATMNVVFLWGPTNATPLVGSILPSTPTNGQSSVNFNAAWNLILNDPNFHLAVDDNTSALALEPTAAGGNWAYTTTGGFSAFPVSGTTAAMDYSVFVIGWDKTFATPQLAASAGSVVGWSAPFSYHTVNIIGTPQSFSAAGFSPFGVTVPEPSAFTLTSLGGVALMLFRCGNKCK